MMGTGADRRIWAAVTAAGSAMALCFALRWTAETLAPLPWEPPAAVLAGGAELVDLNAAGLEELMTLPGIGEVRAQAILEDRASNGPYRYPEELIRVKGIGEETLGNILDRITAGGNEIAQDIGG